MKIGQYGRQARPEEVLVYRQDRPDPAPVTERSPVKERLAHRALGLLAPRPTASLMSQQARDRLYERMFPQHICGGHILGDRGDEQSD